MPPVINVAAHGDMQHAVGGTVSLERHPIAVGQCEYRKVGGHNFVVRRVEFSRTPDRGSRTVNAQVVDADALGRFEHLVTRSRGPASRLRPAWKKIVDFYGREIGFDIQAFVFSLIIDFADNLDRDGARY